MASKSISYNFDKKTESFVITNYNQTKPFASFLPGIAGKNGIPLWAFYVNRGQCISSFGINDKNNAILEFFPANNAYKMTPINGFRTFIKRKNPKSKKVQEIFSLNGDNSLQRLLIRPEGFSIEEVIPNQLQFTVNYFIFPNSPFAGLVRKLSIKNLSNQSIKFDLLDGLAQVIPYGVNMETAKNMSYTAQAWMTVENLEHDIAFFKMSMGSADSIEVSEIKSGNFGLSFSSNGQNKHMLKPIVDGTCIFGKDTSLDIPQQFSSFSLSELYKQRQITEGRTPCYFVGKEIELEMGHEEFIYTIFGQVNDIDYILSEKTNLTQIDYIEDKKKESVELIASIMADINVKSRNPLFDLYSKQTYLDNVLRGGYPIIFPGENQSKVFHLYIRKHGDQERDYNWFYLEPSPYSQGDGNFRDINQNRRCDVSFHPNVGDFNVKTFMNLIQADGFNPLVIRGSKFRVLKQNLNHISPLIKDDESLMNSKNHLFEKFVSKSFSLGSLMQFISKNNFQLTCSREKFVESIMFYADQSIDSVHGEGYWIDHWTYNLDLIINYLSIYPEKKRSLFFDDKSYTFYDNYITIRPRSEKYVLVDDKVRQYDHLFHDIKKQTLIQQRMVEPNKVRTEHGKGEVYRTTLLVKYFSLILNKFATVDPYGMGIEMESSKPGWSDAMNGLPGIFGSSMPETFELYRYCQFLLEILNEIELSSNTVFVPLEIYDFYSQIKYNLTVVNNTQKKFNDYQYWDEIAKAREIYRKNVFYGFEGKEREISLSEIAEILQLMLTKIQKGINRALELNGGIYPTYFYFEAEKYHKIETGEGKIKINAKNQPNVIVEQFVPKVLPIFLEGFVRALKIQNSREDARNIHKSVLRSELYDQKLKMFKLNASLADQPNEIGRAKGFTSGWLENGSIWMHMEYKYLLELLNARLYPEFFNTFRDVLIPFQDPEQYGRPIIENSSFICSSAYPDKKLHGNGFYARLSGSTAEFLNIWVTMMVGENPFFLDDTKQLCLQFKPIIADWMFTEKNILEFKFLSHCDVVYHNPNQKNTYEDCSIHRIFLWDENDAKVELDSPVIKEPYSYQIREGNIKKIEIFFD